MYNLAKHKGGIILLRMGESNISKDRHLISILIVFILSIFFTSILFIASVSNATSLTSDFEVRVSDMLELSVSTCNSANNSLVEVDVEPSVAGTFKSNCQDVSVNTNNPGYSLLAKATSSNPNYQSGAITNSLLYINPTTITPTPAIPSTTNTIASPNILSNNTWGFAVQGLNQTDTSSNLNTTPNFDTTYTIDGQNNKFASLPTTDTIIYKTESFPLPVDTLTFFYATKLTPSTMAGSYTTTITYTAIGEVIPPAPKTCKNHEYAPECIEFTVDVGTTGTYLIPTSGQVSAINIHAYNWDVYVDGYLTDDCNDGNCIGEGFDSSDGIELSNLSDGTHQILITPHNSPAPGWGNAFGHYGAPSNANSDINREKLISIDSPLTTMAFAPKTTESTTDARFMFGFTFLRCSNLVEPAYVIDTYKLPDTIIDLSGFMYSMHNLNINLRSAIDLTGLSDWLYHDNTIESFSRFLIFTHGGNTSLEYPIDLSPVSNWLNHNTSINDFGSFLYSTHGDNTNLKLPVDLSPVRNWFHNNNTITKLNQFFSYTHDGNTNLKLPIDLSPVSEWFKNNNTITDLSFIFTYTYYDAGLVSPIDLSPLSGWFYENTSISNLGYFFFGTHLNNNNLLSPLDLTPTSDWFTPNRTMQTLDLFMGSTHANNTKLFLSGQVVLPNWIKTMTDGNGKNIWNVGSSSTDYSFYGTYHISGSSMAGDTEEVKFEDGTVLSSLGSPTGNRLTYTRRSGIIPKHSNWK